VAKLATRAPLAHTRARVRESLRARAGCVRRRVAIAVAAAALCRALLAPSAALAAPMDGEEAAAAAALRDALAARAAGDVADADARFERAARSHPLIGDHAQRLRADLLLEAGELDRAILAARGGLADHPRSPLRARLHRLEGQAFLDAGSERAARAALEQALAADPGRELRAELELELADSLARAGARREAAARYREVWTAPPSFDLGERAGQGLAALESLARTRLHTPEDQRRRGDALLARQRTEAALAAYDAALAGGLAPDARRRALAKRAECLFLLRRYPEAAEAFGALAPRDPEARLWRGRAVARAGDVRAGAQQLESLASDVGGELGARARYLAALLFEDEDLARSRALFAAVARDRAAPADVVTGALWALGWDAWRARRDGEARAAFDRLADAERSALVRLRARYWSARARERSDAAGAARALGELAAEYPLSYYGWRAAGRLAEHAAPRPPGTLLPAGRAALRPRDLARPRILIAAGLADDARAELDRLAGQAGGAADRIELATLYAEAAAFDTAQRLLVRAYEEDLARGPRPGGEEAWWLAWPRAYEAQVERAAAATRAGVNPALVHAVMREESGYQATAISTVGARGLLQIMPDTGARLARQLGIAGFRPDDLFQPNVNIRLGAAYLAELWQRFDGRASAAIGSYNAGPEAVARWLDERPKWDDDEWVEAIPYQQTREYVRRVLRSLNAYGVLY
jgi:soluble lytic murein transglycosylase